MSPRILIIGAGMATAYLLQELEKFDCQFDLTVIGDEQDCCYNRVLLSSLLAGETTEQSLQMLPTNQPLSARFVTGTRVLGVDIENKRVHCDQGDVDHWDQLIFATGSTVAKPLLQDIDGAGIEVFRTLEDTRHLLATFGQQKKVVIVGGGLLGLEAAHGLNKLGHHTTVLHRNSRLMNRQLDDEGGRQLQRMLESQGIHFCLEDSIGKIVSSNKQLSSIELDSGRQVNCDLLLFATGIVPNKQLAEDAGLAVDRGILVDSNMRGSLPHTFAIGECSQLGDQCFGLVAPIREQAKALASQLINRQGPSFSPEDWPTQLKISGIDIYSAGQLDQDAEQVLLRDPANGVYRRLVIRDNRLIGAVLVGDKRGGTWYAQLIKSGQNIAALRQGLMFGPEIAQSLLPAAA